MAKRPKTVDVMQTFSRRAGIWLRFRQITPSHRRHIPARREWRIKGGRFSARIRSEGPRCQMQDFETRARGELLWQNRNFYRTEDDADFRERVSRSIWPSKLGLSGHRILPAGGILSFGGEVSLQRCVFLSAGEGVSFAGKVPISLRL